MKRKRPRSALLVVDLQRDFLERPGLAPRAELLCARVAELLAAARARRLPIAHARTLVRPDGRDRMPHWRRRGVRACVAGTPGAEAPRAVDAVAGELVTRKTHYDAFADPRLEAWLREHEVEHVVIAGLYLHACGRQTALAAYERGFAVTIAADAVGTPEALHGEATREWLAARSASFRTLAEVVAELDGSRSRPVASAMLPTAVIGGKRRSGGPIAFVHRDPCRSARVLARVPAAGAEVVAAASAAAAKNARAWRKATAERRAEALTRFADALERRRRSLAALVVREVAKPRRFAEDEIGRAVAHARLAAELCATATASPLAPGIAVALRPHGVVGLVTPWNNPVAIPVGKIAPALALGNGVVWKPAPQSSRSSLALLEILSDSIPSGLVGVVLGGAETARALCLDEAVDAVSVTGSLDTGRRLAALCAWRMIPLQAELGGNNAAIVLADADLERAARELAGAAFAFAGQRCTAIRRFVVERSIAARFERHLKRAVEALTIGDPAAPATDVGPLISAIERDRVRGEIERALSGGARLVCGGAVPRGREAGAWLTPAVLADVDPASAIAQEETFGPVALIQRARGLADALSIANGVPHGLLMSVATRSERARARVLAAAEAGIVQLASGPLAVDPRAPFGGWKASGLGPPEHGTWDAAFYARTQAIYEDAQC